MEQITLFGDENKEEDLKRIDELREKIKYHNRLYYENDEPEISDFEYDKLTQELKKLEARYPEYVNSKSPTQIIGGKTKKIFAEVKHNVPMQSLQDVFNFEDVIEFLEKVRKECNSDVEFCVETKIDGLSVSLEYENGLLVRGSTRGNGNIGEDVTQNIECIKSIPMELPSKDTIEVRGEVFLARKEFERLNKELEENGKKLLANPRNTAAGTLRQLDSSLVSHRNLDIFVFNVQKSETRKFTKHNESLEYCKRLGLHTLDYCIVCKTNEEVIEAINKIGKLRSDLEYDIDGAVVKVNDLALRNTLGTTIKVPKWAVAYKYPPEQQETEVIDIIMQVGRTGKITPMAALRPVKVAGSTISSVTLHNFDYLEQKDVRIGDICVIQKAGDVIPELDHVVLEKRTKKLPKFKRPTVCPKCGEPLVQDESVVDLRCVNPNCPALLYRSIVHFVSRDCMDISGLGESLIEKLIQYGKIKDIADIYYLKYDDFYGMDNLKEKSANNLINAIEKTKSNSLDKLLFGMGIRNVGKSAAKVLASKYNDIYEIANESEENLCALEDFGPSMAKSVKKFFENDKTKEIIKKLENAGVNIKGNKNETVSDKLKDMNICITGSFDNYTRDDIVKIIEENSGKFVNSVSKKTDILIAGENAGSKLKKAEELNVKVIDIEEFLKIVNN